MCQHFTKSANFALMRSYVSYIHILHNSKWNCVNWIDRAAESIWFFWIIVEFFFWFCFCTEHTRITRVLYWWWRLYMHVWSKRWIFADFGNELPEEKLWFKLNALITNVEWCIRYRHFLLYWIIRDCALISCGYNCFKSLPNFLKLFRVNNERFIVLFCFCMQKSWLQVRVALESFICSVQKCDLCRKIYKCHFQQFQKTIKFVKIKSWVQLNFYFLWEFLCNSCKILLKFDIRITWQIIPRKKSTHQFLCKQWLFSFYICYV